MRKWRGILTMVISFLLIEQLSLLAEGSGLTYLTKEQKPIKVFVKEFINESGQNQILSEEFKKIFQEALLNRKAVKFVLAKSPDTSDIQISGVIKKYQYSKNDPITSYAGGIGLMIDAATTENYVEMAAEFTIKDTKTSRIVWKDTVSTFIKKMMTPQESIPLIYEKLSRIFLWKSFGKPSASEFKV